MKASRQRVRPVVVGLVILVATSVCSLYPRVDWTRPVIVDDGVALVQSESMIARRGDSEVVVRLGLGAPEQVVRGKALDRWVYEGVEVWMTPRGRGLEALVPSTVVWFHQPRLVSLREGSPLVTGLRR